MLATKIWSFAISTMVAVEPESRFLLDASFMDQWMTTIVNISKRKIAVHIKTEVKYM